MIEAKQDLLKALASAIQDISPESALQAAFESPKLAAHGDLACTAAMQLAKPLTKNPREVAQTQLGTDDGSGLHEVAGAGHGRLL